MREVLLRDWDSCNVYRYSKLGSGELKVQAANCINWYDAKKFCEWVGGDLPSIAQWEYAARAGLSDYIYPWGKDKRFPPNCNNAVVSKKSFGLNDDSSCQNAIGPSGPCTQTTGNTDVGVCDMLGNLWEWVLDSAKAGESWLAPYKTIKGGAFNSVGEDLTIIDSTSPEHPSEPHSPTRIGFRCIQYI